MGAHENPNANANARGGWRSPRLARASSTPTSTFEVVNWSTACIPFVPWGYPQTPKYVESANAHPCPRAPDNAGGGPTSQKYRRGATFIRILRGTALSALWSRTRTSARTLHSAEMRREALYGATRGAGQSGAPSCEATQRAHSVAPETLSRRVRAEEHSSLLLQALLSLPSAGCWTM
jgi:hypothetical protein